MRAVVMNKVFRRILPGRAKLDADHLAAMQSIPRSASRADPETWSRVAAELRAQISDGPPRLQSEIDRVIAKYRETHPERMRGGENAVHGPMQLGPNDGDDATEQSSLRSG
ncbi:hypothetical protein ACFYO1_43180 [Nocardia sp. NPDC006044]|uniref:hypothetical protein n=1 Tax=Nocardia sp. NPDC006044 TaxID=3364306 RepID=UPI0036AA4102